MIKKTIKYKDFTGEETEEDFYFNLTPAELIELEISAEGNSLSEWLGKISRNLQGDKLVQAFKMIIAKSYGVKSQDDRRFIKNEQVLSEFTSTMAYSDLFMQLATDAEFAAEFVNGLMPENFNNSSSATQQSGLSPSEAARKASEARLQGHRKPQPAAPAPKIERQPDLPMELQTAPPVLESQEPIVAQPAEEETREQFEARIRNEYMAKAQASGL